MFVLRLDKNLSIVHFGSLLPLLVPKAFRDLHQKAHILLYPISSFNLCGTLLLPNMRLTPCNVSCKLDPRKFKYNTFLFFCPLDKI